MENTQKQNLSTKEIFSFGFSSSKKYFWYFVLLFLISIVVSVIGEIPFIGWFVSMVFSIYLSVCFLNTIIKISRNAEIRFKDFFIWPKSGFRTILTSSVTALIIGVFSLISFLTALPIFLAVKNSSPISPLAIISGIIFIAVLLVIIHVIIRLSFAKFYAIENNTWPKESIKTSWNGTKGYSGDILFIWIISIGVIIIGILALVIGLFWAIPTIYVVQAFVYTKLFQNNEENTIKYENNVVVQPLELESLENTDTVKDEVLTETN
jgi:hypothetical protein